MDIDETTNRVFITDLENEIEEIESQEEDQRTPFVLPMVERSWSSPSYGLPPPKIPPPANQLVLYQLPRSLSVPEEHDSIRAAFHAARDRASAKLHSKFQPPENPSSQPSADARNNSDHDNPSPCQISSEPPDPPEQSNAMELDD